MCLSQPIENLNKPHVFLFTIPIVGHSWCGGVSFLQEFVTGLSYANNVTKHLFENMKLV